MGIVPTCFVTDSNKKKREGKKIFSMRNKVTKSLVGMIRHDRILFMTNPRTIKVQSFQLFFFIIFHHRVIGFQIQE